VQPISPEDARREERKFEREAAEGQQAPPPGPVIPKDRNAELLDGLPQQAPPAPAPDETKKAGEDPAADKPLTTEEHNAGNDKPEGSVGVCVAGGIQAMESASGDACVVFDSRGVGWVLDQDIGVMEPFPGMTRWVPPGPCRSPGTGSTTP
jgi:hypothetical protein